MVETVMRNRFASPGPGVVTDSSTIQFFDIVGVEDVFDWLRDTFIPEALTEEVYNGDTWNYAANLEDDAFRLSEPTANLGQDFSPRLVMYNRVVFSAHVTQERGSTAEMCRATKLNEYIHEVRRARVASLRYRAPINARTLR